MENAHAKPIWIQSLGQACHFSFMCPCFACDNISATYLTSNPLHARTKHIEIDYYFVRDCVAAKALDVHFISGKDQLANILTKTLGFLMVLYAQIQPQRQITHVEFAGAYWIK